MLQAERPLLAEIAAIHRHVDRLLVHGRLLELMLTKKADNTLDQLHLELFAYSVANARYRSFLLAGAFSTIVDSASEWNLFRTLDIDLGETTKLPTFRSPLWEEYSRSLLELFFPQLPADRFSGPAIASVGSFRIARLLVELARIFRLYEEELHGQGLLPPTSEAVNPGVRELYRHFVGVCLGGAEFASDIPRQDPISVASGVWRVAEAFRDLRLALRNRERPVISYPAQETIDRYISMTEPRENP